MKKKDVFGGDMGKKRMGMKGLELNGGYSFIKKSSSKKSKSHKSKKLWSWD